MVRVSGPRVPQICSALLGALPPARKALLRTFRDASGESIDQGIALYYAAPHSYTGEDVLELQGHGGAVVLQVLLRACLAAGARLAEPGEFTRRAFLAGRIDLAQAEAVADLIDASSREAARSALRSLSGEFSAVVRRLAAQLVELRVLVEALLDFPEEDVESLHRRDAEVRLQAARRLVGEVIAASRQGSLLRTGLHVVLSGPPNVGKSSLLNRLAGEERAIVTEMPGTTRDVLREPLQIDGVPVVLVDTAGLRAASDVVERIGVARAREELQRADIILEVREAGAQCSTVEELPVGTERIVVYNKMDLAPQFCAPSGERSVCVSAKTGSGLENLRHAIVTAAGWKAAGENVFLARERHLEALGSVASHLEAAAAVLAQWEFFAEELRLAHQALGAITGEVSSDELLGEIFSRFCIGK